MTPVYQRLREPDRKKQVCKAAKQSFKKICNRAEFQTVVPFKRFRINNHKQICLRHICDAGSKNTAKVRKMYFLIFPKLSKL